jgi:hypothetical protein
VPDNTVLLAHLKIISIDRKLIQDLKDSVKVIR